MTATKAELQAMNIQPPRDPYVVHLAVTSTVANQDLTALNFSKAQSLSSDDTVFLTLCSMGGDTYVSFSTANVAGDETTTGQATKCMFPLPQGIPVAFRIRKNQDKVLNYKSASGKTADLFIYASSHVSQGP